MNLKQKKANANKPQSLNSNISECKYIKANYYVPFTSLKMKNPDNPNDFSDTCFYRDLYTLWMAKNILQEKFPEGTDIMDFACSNGEEAISIHSLLNKKNNAQYNLHCYDKSQKAIDLAQKGIYTIFTPIAEDDFLLQKYQKNEIYDTVADCFHEIVEETKKPNHEINDPDFLEFIKEHHTFKLKYFKINDKYKHNFEFNIGDINEINKLKPDKKVGAVFFRNAFYIPTKNYALDEFDINIDNISNTIDRKKILIDIIDKIYDKLLPNGLLIIGENEKDHIYLADKKTKKSNVKFVTKYAALICEQSPLYEALSRDGRFKPVVHTRAQTSLGQMEFPTVWEKVK